MIQLIDIDVEHTMAEYATDTVLRNSVEAMQNAVTDDVAALDGRTVWMVNSTASGGGVAEMMPKLVSLSRALGVDAKWAVIDVDEPVFFEFTKGIHNLLHGAGNPELVDHEREVYEATSRSVADELADRIAPNDVLVVHDPQPLAAGAMVVEELDVPAVWRCHIGSEEHSEKSRTAWEFLKPWISDYDRTVFTLPAYVPDFLATDADIIPPAIDPFSAKNRRMKPQEVATVLARADLIDTGHPVEQFGQPARRLQADGSFAPATEPADIGLLFRPTICQISRWDSLKGFVPLLRGFAELKRDARSAADSSRSDDHRERIENARLLLVGPDPSSVADDPEGRTALENLEEEWLALDPELRDDAAVIVMPPDQHESALVINALQRCSTVVAQNSLQEGFGLTVTEAMWKRAVLMGSDTGGITAQIRDGKDGRLVPDSGDPASVAETLDSVLEAADKWDDWSYSAQRHVTDNYLVFEQVTRWLETLGLLVR
ncbi:MULTISPECIES: glycosyltransferase [unclassified Haladaptatus]|uniref:glycosyltransferase n=1 Tax=unclassified Haladaptatus TaxID=2622732 RepID=UPI00209C008B|nr:MULTISPECIES: glycosyltransferase [unclassified Haladaptatus]MCO8242540.1 glycosyltransferase [Haladaptatus sp. AB643]MCO8252297.1 glycosyltransferase [Haladaptatus sp. AB618]